MSQTYQSRIFSFISSRTNQLKDTCAKGWRHLKVSVVWSGQILLHPLQILAQASKILKPQLPPARQPTPDINIEEALYLIETAGYSIKIAIPESFDSDKPKFDTALSPQISELFIPQEPNQPSSIESNSTYQQPQPARSNFRARVLTSLSKGTEILKHQPLADERFSRGEATPTDLTQFVGVYRLRSAQVASPLENRTEDGQINYTPSKPIVRGLSSRLSDRHIVLVTTDNELIDTLTIAQQQQIRHRIGIDLATTWERWHTSRLSPTETTRTLPTKSQALLSSETNLPAESLFDRFNNWLYNFSRAPQSSPTPIELPIPPRKDPQPQQLTPAPSSTPFVARIRQQAQWLDLPQLPPIAEIDRDLDADAQIISATPTNLLTKLQPNWLKQWVNYYQDYIYIDNHSGEIVESVEEFKLTPIEPKYDIIKSDSKIKQSRFSGMSPNFQRNNVEYYPDWIDTTAEEMGYTSSPFSRVLMLLDRIAVKIENWLIGIWKSLQRSSNSET